MPMRGNKIRKWHTSRRKIQYLIQPVAPVPSNVFDILKEIYFYST